MRSEMIMKKCLLVIVLALIGSVLLAAPRQKAVVYVDHFIPVKGENCVIKDSDVQVLQDRIIGNVVSSRKYEVVERENLEKVQKELKLVDAGMTEGNAPDSNQLKAAGYIIYGKVIQFRNYANQATVGDVTVTMLKGTVELQIRIVNIATSRQLAAKTIKKEISKRQSNAIASSQDLALEVMTEALDLAAKDVVLKLNEIAFPTYITDADGKYVTANISAEQVAVGEIWKIWRRRGKKFDPETNEQDGYREKEMGLARVKYPGPKETKFELLDKELAKEIEDYIDAMDGRINLDKALILRKVDGEEATQQKSPKPKQNLRDMF
jgi:signal peptidase I